MIVEETYPSCYVARYLRYRKAKTEAKIFVSEIQFKFHQDEKELVLRVKFPLVMALSSLFLDPQ